MIETKYPFAFRTSLQCSLESRASLPSFEHLLQVLHEEGFYGIELNLPALNIISPDELNALIKQYRLKLHMLATGTYARVNGFSLSDADTARRSAAVKGCKQNIAYAAAAGCGVIIGFFKGQNNEAANARNLLIQSLHELAPCIEQYGVTLLLEATNRSECSVAHTIDDTSAIIAEVGCPHINLLADTYHMHLEEPPVVDSLLRHMGKFDYLHLSDNNRAFPGLGTLDFTEIFICLHQMNYKGHLSIEGNIRISAIDDILRSSAYLHEANNRARKRLQLDYLK